MTSHWFPIIVILTLVSLVITNEQVKKKAKKRKHYPDQIMWKKEYEEQLAEAIGAAKKTKEFDRNAVSVHSQDNEMVLDKLVETITSSERYFKKIDSIDFKLNRLDIEVHEHTNSILKHLVEIAKMLESYGLTKMEQSLDKIKMDVGHIKMTLESGGNVRTMGDVDGREFAMDIKVSSKLDSMEHTLKTVLEGVENIITIIAEVKNRPMVAKGRARSDYIGLDALSLVSDIRKTLMEQKMKKCECKANGRIDRSDRYPTDCNEIQMQGFNVSGIYKIKPDDYESFYVLCDLATAGGGWTVFQNRFDGSQNFFKTWSDYKYGFGNLAGEFWLGLEKLHYLTTQKLYELRIEMETQHGLDAFAGYSVFSIGPEGEGFRVSTLGTYYGTAGDSFSYHAGQKFSTVDVDNDEWKDGACTIEHGGAWWYKECDKCNLNGNYNPGGSGNEETRGSSMYWISLKGPGTTLSKTRMMIRPLPASRPSDVTDISRNIINTPSRGAPDKLRNKGPIPEQRYKYDEPVNTENFYP